MSSIRERLTGRKHIYTPEEIEQSYTDWRKELDRMMYKTLAITIGMQIAAALFIALLFSR